MGVKSGIVEPLTDRIYLFNYFEKPEDESAFLKMWGGTAKFLQTKEHFISTHLHQAVDEKAMYPWVNFAVFDSEDICVFGKPDPGWQEEMRKGMEAKLKAFPGQYREIASFNGNVLTNDNKERPEDYRFLLTGVVADDSITNDDLEANWTAWMGVDFIREKLKDNPALKDTLLYRFTKGRFPRFRYTVRTELTGLSNEEGQAIAEACNKRSHAKGVETFTGFYSIRTNLFFQA